MNLQKITFLKKAQGESFSKIFDEPNSNFREYAYSRYGKADGVVTNRYSISIFNKCNSEELMLYDHLKDPQENINIAQDKENLEIVTYMRTLVGKSIIRATLTNSDK